MTSKALQSWQTRRVVRLQELLHAHALVCGSTAGRWRTAVLNGALVLRLAAEFQGFARDLHNEAAAVFAAWSMPGNAAVQWHVEWHLLRARDLDRSNAHPGAIGNDFRRFGLAIWPAMIARDGGTQRLNRSLDRLNAARNALAHSDDGALRQLRADGWPIIIRTYRQWQRDLTALTVKMDEEVADWLGALFGRSIPW